MLLRLLLAFILIPLAELFLLLWLADQTSALFTVAIVIVTGIAGTFLAKYAGLKAWNRFRDATSQGRIPSVEIQHGLMIAFAAALLLTPGLMTDTVGLLLLVEPVRDAVRRYLAARWKGKVTFMQSRTTTQHRYGNRRDDDVVDAEGFRNVPHRESHVEY